MRVRYFSPLAIGLAVLLNLPAALYAEEKRAPKPEDMVDLRGVSDPQISPDGKRVAVVVTEPADPEKYDKPRDTNIWVAPADGSEPARPFANSPKNDVAPRWSPDGRYLAFLSNRGKPTGEEKEAKNQLFLLRTDGGEAEQLTAFKGEVLAFKWSRDGGMIAFTVRDAKTEEEEKAHKRGDDKIYVDHDNKFARLWVLALAESPRRPEPVTRQDLEVSDLDWSPEGSELVVRVSRTPRLDDVIWNSSLVVVRRLTGEVVRTLSDRAGAFGLDVRWSPDGQTIVFPEFTPQKISGRLALVPAAGGPPRHLAADYRGTFWGLEWGPDSQRLIGESLEGTRAKLVSVDAATGEVTRLAEAWGDRPGFSVSADGRTIAYINEPAEEPGDVWAFTIGQAPRRLTQLNPQAASWQLGEVKEITWKNRKDGTTLYGVLITPPDFKPGRRYPTIVQVHGGPQWGWWTGWHGSWHEWGQCLASHGYVVFLPNPRGSTGQGWQFAEANIEDWGGMDFRDIMDGLDDLVEQGIADPQRLGIGGWSYGGFMTSWTVTQTSRFKAAVVGAAVTNLFSFNGTTDITPSFLKGYFRDIPFRRRAVYDNHSAMTFLEKCKTPSLVVHPQADERVPVGQGWEFYNGLKMLGVETEMVVYPREPHGLKERAHQLDLLTRILAWYDKYLRN